MQEQFSTVAARRLLVALMMPYLLSSACVSKPGGQESNGALEEVAKTALEETLSSAASTSETYELADLDIALESLAGAEAWGEVIHIDLPSQGNFAQMVLTRNGVDFHSMGNDVSLKTFREETAKLSLTPKAVGGKTIYASPDSQGEDDLLFVEIRGDWSQVAFQVIQLIKGVYGANEDDEVAVSVLG